MNKVILMGRLTRDPDVRHSMNSKGEDVAVARYTLAVDRRYKKEGEQNADFITCVTFGKSATFAEMYLHQGTKVTISGRIQTGSYTKKDGTRVYTTDVVVEEQEFAESKASQQSGGQQSAHQSEQKTTYASDIPATDDFMDLPDGIDEELPFA